MTTATTLDKPRSNGAGRPTTSKPKPQGKKTTLPEKPSGESTIDTMERELSVAQIIVQSAELQHLIDQRSKLVDRRDSLRALKHSQDDNTVILNLSDLKGHEFQVSKDAFVNETVHFMDGLLSTRIDEYSDQILAYNF